MPAMVRRYGKLEQSLRYRANEKKIRSGLNCGRQVVRRFGQHLPDPETRSIYVVTGDFKWNDIGSWSALYDVLNTRDDGNIVRGNGKVMNGKNNLIQSNGRFTAVLGLSDLVVVNTDDATLIVPRDKVEDVKDLVAFLKKDGQSNLI